ncbi:MAG TPA: hypothetical protein DCQ06_06445 [Myxococcales bacterium]|nr:hypothetical protein [Myxococcales bacterium]
MVAADKMMRSVNHDMISPPFKPAGVRSSWSRKARWAPSVTNRFGEGRRSTSALGAERVCHEWRRIQGAL